MRLIHAYECWAGRGGRCRDGCTCRCHRQGTSVAGRSRPPLDSTGYLHFGPEVGREMVAALVELSGDARAQELSLEDAASLYPTLWVRILEDWGAPVTYLNLADEASASDFDREGFEPAAMALADAWARARRFPLFDQLAGGVDEALDWVATTRERPR